MFETIQFYLEQGLQSEFFAGGMALGAFGIILGVGRTILSHLVSLLRRWVMVTVEVDNRLGEFRHLLVWLEHRGALTRARRFRLSWAGGRFKRKAILGPAAGGYWFRADGHWVRLEREISEKARAGSRGRSDPLETLRLTMPFGRVETLQRWIDEGAALVEAATRIGPELYIHADGYWQGAGQVTARSAETLVAVDDRIERLIEDVRWFYDAPDWYRNRGVPWRRGYLLYGPPGTGKSSAIRAVASELSLDVAFLDVGRPHLGDDQLAEAVATAPDRSVLVIEDVDAAFTGRKKQDEKIGGVSFSGLLNALDGVAAQEGRAVFLTTNHIERLDPALIRPGRVDVRIELGLVGAGAARALFLRFFPGEEHLAEQFADALQGMEFAPAALQGWLLANANDPEAAAMAAVFVPPARLAAE